MEDDESRAMCDDAGVKGTITYVFSMDEDAVAEKVPPDGRLWEKTWRIVPCFCASLSCIPFGLALGWPSPMNPILLKENSTLRIDMPQTAMVAGFLMLGNTAAMPFSSSKALGLKNGIILGNAMMVLGWIIMWQARNIFWYLGSRFSVGFGHGFALGQLRLYIAAMSDDRTRVILTKMIPLYVYVAVIAIFSYGPFLGFKRTSLVALVTTAVILTVTILLPSAPPEAGKHRTAGKILATGSNVNGDVNKMPRNFIRTAKERGLAKLLTSRDCRKNLFVFIFLVFCQQFSGVPATIIYSIILLERSMCPYPEYFAIGYVMLYFLANVFSVFVLLKYNRRLVLLLSSFSVSVTIVAHICIVIFGLNNAFWEYSSTTVMFLFMISHTLGLGNVPFSYIPDLFPVTYRTSAVKLFVMFHSILALIITKLFQVMIEEFDIGVPFCLFLTVSLSAFIFAYFYMPKLTESSGTVNVDIPIKVTEK